MNIVLKVLLILSLINSPLVLAASEKHSHQHDDLETEKTVSSTENAKCEDKIDMEVNGLVCDFCARAVEKVFSKRPEVTGVDVDLDEARISVAVKPKTTIDDATLKKLVNDSGYNLVAVERGCE